MDHAALWSSDLDMYPALEALTETRVRSTLHYAPNKTSAELIATADESIALTCKKLLRTLRKITATSFLIAAA